MGRCNHGLKHRDRCDNRPATPKDDGPIVGAWTRVWRQTHTLVVSLPATARPASSAGRSRDPAAGDADRLRREVRHVVLHEIAHHFGISDARLIGLDRD
jgi:Zincin-like metallopeptidase